MSSRFARRRQVAAPGRRLRRAGGDAAHDPARARRRAKSRAASLGTAAALLLTLGLADLFFSLANTSLGSAVTSEAVAEAVVARLVGSIGLIVAVPATTALAALLALHLPERSLRQAHVHAH